jgi:hypothetical protein
MATYAFKQWEDGSTNPVRTLTMIENKIITATYEPAVAPPPTPRIPIGYILVPVIIGGIIVGYLLTRKK